MSPRQLYSVIIFTILLILAILIGNWFLVTVSGRPIEKIPNIFKFIVHGFSLGLVAVLAKKYFGK